MAEGPRTALVTGEFDFLGQLLAGEKQIREKAGDFAVHDELRVKASRALAARGGSAVSP